MNQVTEGNNEGRCQAYVKKCKNSPIQIGSTILLASAAVAAASLGAPPLMVLFLGAGALTTCPSPMPSNSDRLFGNVQLNSGSHNPSNNATESGEIVFGRSRTEPSDSHIVTEVAANSNHLDIGQEINNSTNRV